MCRYAMHPTKTHYACLPCRHTAKFPRGTSARCPRCRAPMIDLGHDFKAPRRTNLAQWEKVRLLAAAGITFHSCGCTGPGPRPLTLTDAKTLLRLRRADRKQRAA